MIFSLIQIALKNKDIRKMSCNTYSTMHLYRGYINSKEVYISINIRQAGVYKEIADHSTCIDVDIGIKK